MNNYDNRPIELTKISLFSSDDLGGRTFDYLLLGNGLMIDIEEDELLTEKETEELKDNEIVEISKETKTVKELLDSIRYSQTHLYRQAFKQIITAYYHK